MTILRGDSIYVTIILVIVLALVGMRSGSDDAAEARADRDAPLAATLAEKRPFPASALEPAAR